MIWTETWFASTKIHIACGAVSLYQRSKFVEEGSFGSERDCTVTLTSPASTLWRNSGIIIVIFTTLLWACFPHCPYWVNGTQKFVHTDEANSIECCE